jgi:hypothetical protein
MKEARLRANAPTWMIRMYVADDPPVNAPGRLGKDRRRVVISNLNGVSGDPLSIFTARPSVYTEAILSRSTLGTTD